MRKPLTIEYIKKIAEEHEGKCLSSYYKNNKTKLYFACKNGHKFYLTPTSLKKGVWCKECMSFSKNRKYFLDEDFFSKDTEESFYIAGFIAADGCVMNKDKSILVIRLSNKDIDHLKKINELMTSTYPIKSFISPNYFKNPNYKKESEFCSLRVNSKKIVKDISRFGIVPAKTYGLEFPDWLLNHEFFNHYLRGYIDGDGSFYERKDGSIQFCLVGTAKLLNQLHKKLINDNILYNYWKSEVKAKIGKKEKVFGTLQYSGEDVKKLYNYLYTNATIFLQRKERIANLSLNKEYRKKKPPLNITKDILYNLLKKYKFATIVAKNLGCTSSNIYYFAKKFGIEL
jgi:hypothetical protein